MRKREREIICVCVCEGLTEKQRILQTAQANEHPMHLPLPLILQNNPSLDHAHQTWRSCDYNEYH